MGGAGSSFDKTENKSHDNLPQNNLIQNKIQDSYFQGALPAEAVAGTLESHFSMKALDFDKKEG